MRTNKNAGHIHLEMTCFKHGNYCAKCFGPTCPKCPKKTFKTVTVEAFFPEAKGNAFFAANATGSNWPIATYRALSKLSKQKGIARKRITTVKLTVSIGTVTDESEYLQYPED